MEKLFGDFQKVEESQWIEKIKQDLKGKDFDEALLWKVEPGLTVQPFYSKMKADTSPGEFPYRRGVRKEENNWLMADEISVNNSADANKEALISLQHGMDSISFVHAFNADEIATVLKDIQIELIEVNVNPGTTPVNVYRALTEKESSLSGGLLFDPLSELLTRGAFPSNQQLDEILSQVRELFEENRNHQNAFRLVTINSGRNVHHAGGGIVQEVAVALSVGKMYVQHLIDCGFPIDAITAHLGFSFTTGASYFPEIAKYRAFRTLWATIINAYEPEHACTAAAYIAAETSPWTITAFDEHTNLLRATTQAMASVISGVNSLYIQPFDLHSETKYKSARRLARNINHILKSESGFHRVADPAGGSYYLEGLTNEIAKEAWSSFQEIEAAGGFVEAMKKGMIQDKISENARVFHDEIKSGKRVFVGVNKYPKEELKTDERGVTVASGDICTPLQIHHATDIFSRA